MERGRRPPAGDPEGSRCRDRGHERQLREHSACRGEQRQSHQGVEPPDACPRGRPHGPHGHDYIIGGKICFTV